jgi:hypothetical protein
MPTGVDDVRCWGKIGSRISRTAELLLTRSGSDGSKACVALMVPLSPNRVARIDKGAEEVTLRFEVEARRGSVAPELGYACSFAR